MAEVALTAISVERLPAVLRYRGLEKEALAMQQRQKIEGLRQDLARLLTELRVNRERPGVHGHD
jgi:hypothetical protein